MAAWFVPHALLVGDLVSPPLQACRLAEVGERRPWSIERRPVPEENVVDELVRVDRQPRVLNRSVIGGAQPSHQIRVLFRLFGGRDDGDGDGTPFRQTEGQEVTGAEAPEPSLRAGPPEIVGVPGGIDALAAGQREGRRVARRGPGPAWR